MSIIIENLSHVYMKGTPFERMALSEINIEIRKGEFVGVIGHTGSGKSTLVQHLNGLLKPASGSITINGLDVSKRNLKELRKTVGLVFQYPEHQLFEETVYKDISFGILRHGFSDEEIKQRVHSSIRAVGLPEDILPKSPFELSGGQKRRVAIAGILVMNVEILILDEPTAGLDPKGKNEILDFIDRLHKDRGLTVILISHNIEDISRVAERIVVMNKGRIAIDGSTRDVLTDVEKLEAAGMAAPSIVYLLRKLCSIVPDISTRVLTVEEAKSEILKYIRSGR